MAENVGAVDKISSGEDSGGSFDAVVRLMVEQITVLKAGLSPQDMCFFVYTTI